MISRADTSILTAATPPPARPPVVDADPKPLAAADQFTPGVAGGQIPENRLREFAQCLPKVDLHRHLEGALTPESFMKLADKYGIELPTRDPEQLRPYLQVTKDDKTLLDFLQKFNTIGLAFTCKDAIRDVTQMVIQDAARDNVKYLELRFSPLYMAGTHGVSVPDVMEGVLEGVRQGTSETGTRVNLIMIVERQMGPGPAREVEKLAEQYKDQGVVALDLANDEFHYPPGPYAEVFQDARQAGLKVTVHAGEAGGAENVKTSIENLGADRIGHGVRTYEDPAVERMVVDRKIPLELNPTSNLQTGAISNYKTYPLRKYFQEGIPVTINTDDPAVSGIDLSNEYVVAMRDCGMSAWDLEKCIINGVEAAFMPEGEKKAMVEQFRQEIAQVNQEWKLSG